MEPEEVILMDSFTLLDAMSAFEVRKCAIILGPTITCTLTSDRRAASRQWDDP